MIRLKMEIDGEEPPNIGPVVKPLLRSDKSNSHQKCTLEIYHQ